MKKIQLLRDTKTRMMRLLLLTLAALSTANASLLPRDAHNSARAYRNGSVAFDISKLFDYPVHINGT